MDIVIDHKIRDWVFIPLLTVMFMVSIFRHYFSMWQHNRR